MARYTASRFTAVTDNELDRTFRRHARGERFASNLCLHMVKTALAEKGKGKDGEIPWSRFDQINAFNSWQHSTGRCWANTAYAQVFEEGAVDCSRRLSEGTGNWIEFNDLIQTPDKGAAWRVRAGF